MLRIAVGLGVAVVAVAGCGSGHPVRSQPPWARFTVARGVPASEPAVSPRPFGAADTAFGLDVLGTWCRAEPRANLVLSPSSLATGLGMAYLGARGDTARAMARVLHLPATGMMPTSAQAPIAPQVVFNRPYLLLGTDTTTGEPLFLARVADPAAACSHPHQVASRWPPMTRMA